MAVKYNISQTASVPGNPLVMNIRTNTKFAAAVIPKPAQAVLELKRNAKNPRGTKKKNMRNPIRIKKRHAAAPIRAGTKAVFPIERGS
jgi:hypothetical protein